jgi:CRP/FNR family cyclic AMP-dependent transcriptional regulator
MIEMASLKDGWRLVRRRALPPVLAPDHPDKVWYLRQTRLFDRLDEADLRRLAALSEMREYPRGEVILDADHDPDRIYFVKTGRVKISTYSAEGKEQILALLEPGDLFGALVPPEPPGTTRVEAFAQSIVCALDRTVFEDVIKKAPEVALQVIRVLARRLRAAETEIEDLALRDVPARVASLLLRVAEEYGERHDRGIRLAFRLTHQDLAHMVGSTRETVTAIMGRFRDNGLIAVEHKTVIVLDRVRLSAIANLGRP